MATYPWGLSSEDVPQVKQLPLPLVSLLVSELWHTRNLLLFLSPSRAKWHISPYEIFWHERAKFRPGFGLKWVITAKHDPDANQTKKMSGSAWRSLTIYGYWQADVWSWTTRRTLTASLSPAWHSMARLFICDIRSQVNVWPVSGSVFGLKMEKGKPKRQTNTDLTSVHDIYIWFRG